MAKLSLSEIVAETRRIPVKGDSYIEVRGLSMADITSLFKRHTRSLTAAFDDLMDSGTPGIVGLNFDEVQAVIQKTLSETPELIGDIIATAMDEPEQSEAASRLRTGVQIQALFAIAELSITTEAELKNAVGAVTKMVTTVTALFREAKKNKRKGLQ